MKYFHGKAKHPIKTWTDYVPMEDAVMEQLLNTANLPFIFKHIAVMPDCHWGMGATVGSVIATQGAICPAAVGVDIGCGMQAVKTNLKKEDIPNHSRLRALVEKAVPHGRTNNGGKNDRGAWQEIPVEYQTIWDMGFKKDYEVFVEKYPKAKAFNTVNHLGTLGGGNHFIELCLDTKENVWVVIHSGSRGLGNKIGQFFINKAKEECTKWFIDLPDPALAYLAEGTQFFDDFLKVVSLAQLFAFTNRNLMMKSVLSVLETQEDFSIDCHHNFVARENHFGKNVLITRKGAVRARKGDFGIIPGSMGAKTYIVKGKGNPESFQSCSHGAGRVMSRRQASNTISLEQHIADTQGVECSKESSILDESPSAYKNIDDVMRSQEDLIEITETLKQFICVKG